MTWIRGPLLLGKQWSLEQKDGNCSPVLLLEAAIFGSSFWSLGRPAWEHVDTVVKIGRAISFTGLFGGLSLSMQCVCFEKGREKKKRGVTKNI